MSKQTWRWIGGSVLLALPAFLLLPGIGPESRHPASLARSQASAGSWYYRVRSGDVLTTIAERELGTFKRYGEILRLNPGIRPRELQLGTVLKMPARDPDGAQGERRPQGPGHAPWRLLLSSAALLGLVFLVVFLSSRGAQRA